jgi:CheY-like chemotaxis protein
MILQADILAARILIVDDQPLNVHLLSRLLAEGGYGNVQATDDPATVPGLHAHQAYDLILLDLQMPGFDGFEVMQALQDQGASIAPGQVNGVLPVIVLTAQPSHKLRALLAGARDFISKPFDLLEVKTRIHHMLEMQLMRKRLAEHNAVLEATVLQRTAELRESEARYRALTELASDWYWEQDAEGRFVRLYGPVFELLGINEPLPVSSAVTEAVAQAQGWDLDERRVLQGLIADRAPFLDYSFQRTLPDGQRRHYRVSGQPLFDGACRFLGYRGVGVDTTPGH